jgi:hypothetical protein
MLPFYIVALALNQVGNALKTSHYYMSILEIFSKMDVEIF